MAIVTEQKSTSTSGSTQARAAVNRCHAEGQRAFDAYMSGTVNDGSNRFYAKEAANTAYCNAMPLLVDEEGIRTFMACLSHGILIGTVPLRKCGQLSHVSQVALSSLKRAPKPAPSSPKNAPQKVQKVA